MFPHTSQGKYFVLHSADKRYEGGLMKVSKIDFLDFGERIVGHIDRLTGLSSSLVMPDGIFFGMPFFSANGEIKSLQNNSNSTETKPLVGTDVKLFDRTFFGDKSVAAIEYFSTLDRDLLVGNRGYMLVPSEASSLTRLFSQTACIQEPKTDSFNESAKHPLKVSGKLSDKVSHPTDLDSSGVVGFLDKGSFAELDPQHAKKNKKNKGSQNKKNSRTSSNKQQIVITGSPKKYSSAYNFKLILKGGWPKRIKNQLIQAATKLAKKFKDVTDIEGFEGGVDDINIYATINKNDGRGGILGSTRVTDVRSSNLLPVRAEIKFDLADFSRLGNKTIKEISTHELMHALGFGVLWQPLGLTRKQNGNYFFTGKHANKIFKKDYLNLAKKNEYIPVEKHGGSGTAGGHWDEQAFGNELMTGFLGSGKNYLSDMSIKSMKDLGYR